MYQRRAPAVQMCGSTHFHLLDLLSQGSTVARSVLSGDADLLCALRHFGGCVVGRLEVLREVGNPRYFGVVCQMCAKIAAQNAKPKTLSELQIATGLARPSRCRIALTIANLCEAHAPMDYTAL